jgi:hypothetical protein
MGAGFRTFVSGEVLTADNVQNYLMDQAVMVFSGTAARSSALPTPETGMTAYSTATGLEVYNGSAWKFIGPEEIAIFNETQASGTDGGTFTSGSFAKRTLNTTVVNTITGCSISSSVISLPAGTYEVHANSGGFKVNNHQARLQNTTAATTLSSGTNAYSVTSDNVMTMSFIDTVFTLTATSNIELQSRCASTQASNGLGPASSFGDEIYRTITIRKIG